MCLNQLCNKVGLISKILMTSLRDLNQGIKELSKDANIVTADLIGLYPSIPHNVGLEALRRTLDDRVNKKKLILRTLL